MTLIRPTINSKQSTITHKGMNNQHLFGKSASLPVSSHADCQREISLMCHRACKSCVLHPCSARSQFQAKNTNSWYYRLRQRESVDFTPRSMLTIDFSAVFSRLPMRTCTFMQINFMTSSTNPCIIKLPADFYALQFPGSH